MMWLFKKCFTKQKKYNIVQILSNDGVKYGNHRGMHGHATVSYGSLKLLE